VTDFFGTFKEIIQLDYNGRSVVLFKYDWLKLDGKRTELKDDGIFRSINVGSLWYKNDCYILATQAMKVFYLPDTRFWKNWQVVEILWYLNRDDEQGPIFEVAEIALLLKVREKGVHDGEREDENEEDDTLFQYCSEDDGGAIAEVNEDDE
jgi:hypothetical protein